MGERGGRGEGRHQNNSRSAHREGGANPGLPWKMDDVRSKQKKSDMLGPCELPKNFQLDITKKVQIMSIEFSPQQNYAFFDKNTAKYVSPRIFNKFSVFVDEAVKESQRCIRGFFSRHVGFVAYVSNMYHRLGGGRPVVATSCVKPGP